MKKQVFAIAIVISALALVSCSDSNSDPKTLSTLGQDELNLSEGQRMALADDEVTREEYDAGFRRYQACMEGLGYSLGSVKEVDGVLQYSVPVVSEDEGGSACYEREFSLIDQAWQTRPEILEQSESSRIIKACLVDNGVDPAGSHAERLEQISANGINPMTCADGG